MNNRILLCIDGTDASLAVVRYAAEVLSAKTCNITLFHVMSRVPEAFFDVEKDPKWLEKVEKVKLFEEKQREYITRFAEKCIDIFLKKGFPQARTAVQISRQNYGIARDIVAEARKEYDVLVIGRGKSGDNPCMPLGGVASKIVSASLRAAVWLVGEVQSGQKDILVGLDGSENSMKAVKHVGRMACDTSCNITLFHAVRRITVPFDGIDGIFTESYGQYLQGDMEREFASIEKLARIWLQKNDIAEERIETTIVANITSRAMAMLEGAEMNNCATIAVGKRGISEVSDFPMGRVTNKLIQLARSHALWIVN